MNRIESSKMILIVSYILMIAITSFAAITFFLGYDIEDLNILLGLTWGEVSLANSFYYWKARAENKIKLAVGIDPNILAKIEEINRLFG